MEQPSNSLKPAVGSTAPHFLSKAVVDGRVKDISLSQFLSEERWVVLMFFPMAWTFICPTEITAFNARLAEFHNLNATIIFASTDSEHVLRSWSTTDKEDGGLGCVRMPLVSDRNHRLAKSYGVLIEDEGVTQRATFIIDPNCTIRHFSVNDANVGRNVEEIKRLLDALAFSDRFGEGCPVDWKRGEDGVRMNRDEDVLLDDPQDSRIYSSPEPMTASVVHVGSLVKVAPSPVQENTPPKSPPPQSLSPFQVTALKTAPIPITERPGLSRGSSWSGWGRSFRARPTVAPELKTGGWSLSNEDVLSGNSRLVV